MVSAKRRWIVFTVIVLTLAALGATAQEFKWAYVDTERLLANYPPALEAQARFDTLMAQWRHEAEYRQFEIDSILADAQRKASTMSATRRQQIQELLAAKSDSMQAFIDEVLTGPNALARRTEDSLLAPITQTLDSIIFDLAEKEGYHAIYDAVRAGFIYADSTADITGEVLRQALIEYNARGQ
jgi:outer membrane protein